MELDVSQQINNVQASIISSQKLAVIVAKELQFKKRVMDVKKQKSDQEIVRSKAFDSKLKQIEILGDIEFNLIEKL